MKVYFNNYLLNKEPVIADIDNITLRSETYQDGYVYEEKGYDIKQIKNIIKGLELMGYHIKKIIIPHATVDLDTKFYHRFPEEVIDKIWNDIGRTWSRGREVYIKGDRIYTKVRDYEIVLPKDMFSDFDSRALRMEFYVG